MPQFLVAWKFNAKNCHKRTHCLNWTGDHIKRMNLKLIINVRSNASHRMFICVLYGKMEEDRNTHTHTHRERMRENVDDIKVRHIWWLQLKRDFVIMRPEYQINKVQQKYRWNVSGFMFTQIEWKARLLFKSFFRWQLWNSFLIFALN